MKMPFPLPAVPAAVRFFKFVTPARDTDCWLWTGSANREGYGRFHYDGRPGYAHRWVYEHFFGGIPNGLEIDHLCRNKSCVNPFHLEAVPHIVNTRRRDAALAAARAVA